MDTPTTDFPELEPDGIALETQLTGDDKGAYGNVWSGHCFGQKVAVKIPKQQDLTPEELKSLRNEIVISFKQPHPNIVITMGACMKEKNIRIVVELMDGDLSDLIQKEPNLHLLDLLDFARQAALGMAWLHGVSHIIHRDLKPANLMYRKNGDTYTIKVGDFGLAVIKKDREKIDEIAGSPLYSAPEVLAGKDYKEEVDVYSFGITLWQIVTKGKSEPFSNYDHDDDFETFSKLVIDGNRPPLDQVPKVKGLSELISACWDSKPSKRPTFKEINEQLQNIMVNAAILDPNGQEFWKLFKFGERPESSVPLLDFLEKLYSYLGIDPQIFRSVSYHEEQSEEKVIHTSNYLPLNDTDSDEENNDNETTAEEKTSKYGILKDEEPAKPSNEDLFTYRCLAEIFSVQVLDAGKKRLKYKDRKITILHFGKILQWFGPLEKNSGKKKREGFAFRVKTTLKLQYFHGDIGQDEAKRKLRGLQPGTFLVRLSGSPGYFVIARMVGSKPPGVFKEGRIEYVPGKGFTIGANEFFPDMKTFIGQMKNRLGLVGMCSLSKYQDLFVPLDPEEEVKEKKKESKGEKKTKRRSSKSPGERKSKKKSSSREH